MQERPSLPLPTRFRMPRAPLGERPRAPARPADLPAERPSFGLLVHVTVAGLFGGALLGAVLAVLVALVGFQPLDHAAFAVAVYAGLAAGGWCGLAIAPAALCGRRPRLAAFVATVIGAGIGTLFGVYFMGWPHPAPALALLGGLAGAGEGLALCCAALSLRKRRLSRAAPHQVAIGPPQDPQIAAGPYAALTPRTEQEAALREQALRSGRATLCVRFVLPALGAVAVAVTAAIPGLSMSGAQEIPVAILGLLPLVLGVGLLGLPVSFGLAIVCRRWSLRRLRRQLAPLPLEERRQLLLTLNESAAPEIREVTKPLLRELRRNGGEITPAAPADGRGDEVGT